MPKDRLRQPNRTAAELLASEGPRLRGLEHEAAYRQAFYVSRSQCAEELHRTIGELEKALRAFPEDYGPAIAAELGVHPDRLVPGLRLALTVFLIEVASAHAQAERGLDLAAERWKRFPPELPVAERPVVTFVEPADLAECRARARTARNAIEGTRIDARAGTLLARHAVHKAGADVLIGLKNACIDFG